MLSIFAVNFVSSLPLPILGVGFIFASLISKSFSKSYDIHKRMNVLGIFDKVWNEPCILTVRFYMYIKVKLNS